MSTDVVLEKALEETLTATPKKRKRQSKKLPIPDLPENKRQFEGAIEVNPETHSLPPESKFTDPLFYWQTRKGYAQKVEAFADARIAELESQTPEQRAEARKAKQRAAQVQRAINNDAVKAALAENPEVLVSGLAPEQVAAMISQLQAMMAEKSVD